ncbi:VWA domain-containing protein [soil metagenome]
MTFSPVIPEPWPWIALVALPLFGMGLAWRASHTLPLSSRIVMLLLRGLAFAVLAVLLLNPGEWEQPEHKEAKLHAVLLDRSASMAVRDADDATRWAGGLAVTQAIAEKGGDQVKTFTFSDTLEGDALKADLKPDGQASAIVHSGIGLFSGASGLGRKLASITLISDGRQTREDAAAELILRARAAQVPLHVVPLGGDWGGRDLVLHVTRRLVMALPDKPVTVGVSIENRGLGLIKPRVQLVDGAGKTHAERDVELDSGSKKVISMEVPKLAGGDYRVVVATQQGEDITRNNEDHLRVQELTSRTRVFIAEGAPYWDSKFLAQLLREQGFMEVRAVYRLNAERYFRVDGGSSEPVISGASTFPESAEDFANLDLIVLGKGAEGFLDAKRIEALKSFVRDRGGALLMARGKSYAGRLPEMEALEPVEWGEAMEGDFRFEPGSVGEAAGLFGQVLPEAQDPLWRQLPVLKDVATITKLKPFTQVMAMGVRPAVGREERVPLLVARHFGRGVVVALNADGLWKWDFDPQARKLGNMYEEFWTQLLQWTASYAEFLPGQELSLRLSESTAKLGHGVRVSIGWRGGKDAPQPKVRLFKEGQLVQEIPASEAESDAEGRRSWTALLQPEAPGTYRVQAFNRDKAGPEAVLQVLAPPSEQESLAADPEFLRQLANATGGEVWHPDQVAALVQRLFTPLPDDSREHEKAIWHSRWSQPWILVPLILLLATEWWSRRRQGLL